MNRNLVDAEALETLIARGHTCITLDGGIYTCDKCREEYEAKIHAAPKSERAAIAEALSLALRLIQSASTQSSWPFGQRRATFLANWLGELDAPQHTPTREG